MKQSWWKYSIVRTVELPGPMSTPCVNPGASLIDILRGKGTRVQMAWNLKLSSHQSQLVSSLLKKSVTYTDLGIETKDMTKR